MTTGNHFGPAVVFESHGFAVAHYTTLWRSHYSIAVKAHGEIGTLAGGDDEPLSHLIARFNPEILADLEYAIEKDKPLDGEPIDLDWEIRRRDVARVREWVKQNEADPVYVPAAYSEGESAFDGIDSRGYTVKVARVATAEYQD